MVQEDGRRHDHDDRHRAASPSAIPLLTKGRGEAENSNVDMNYFLGIDRAKRVLAADFEDTAERRQPSGAGPDGHLRQHLVSRGGDLRRHDVAAVPERRARREVDGRLVGAFTPRFDSIQHAALGDGDDARRGAGRRGSSRARWTKRASGTSRAARRTISDTMDEALFAPQAEPDRPLGARRRHPARWPRTPPGLPNGTLGADVPLRRPTWVAGGSGFVTGLVPGARRAAADGHRRRRRLRHASARRRSTLGASQLHGRDLVQARRPPAWRSAPARAASPRRSRSSPRDAARRRAATSTSTTSSASTPRHQAVLAADFEEAPTARARRPNHPISGATAILPSTLVSRGRDLRRHDAAAVSERRAGRRAARRSGQPPRADSIQHAALGTALNSTGAAAGFFAGALDETRIWNYARTAAQMAAGCESRNPERAPDCSARWSFNDCCGRVVDSTGHVPFGPPPVVAARSGATLQGTGWSWAPRGDTTLSTTSTRRRPLTPARISTVTLPASGALAGVGERRRRQHGHAALELSGARRADPAR